MKIHPVKKMVILGGGSAGWLAAAYFSKKLPELSITLVDKEESTPVGVGEATILFFDSFMTDCGFNVDDWFEPLDATLKHGIQFPNWLEKGHEIWHPFVNSTFLPLNHKISLIDAWSRFQNLDFKNFAIGTYKTAVLNNKIDRFVGCAYHVDCGKLTSFLKNSLKNKIKLVNSEVVSIERDSSNFIKSLLLKNNQIIDGDFFIDCSGFKSFLNLNPDKVDLSNRLLCDTAIAGHVSYEDKPSELKPYVVCDAIEFGWVWKIPTASRIGTGVVFNRSMTNIDDAKQFFLKYWNGRLNPDKLSVIDWTPFYYKKMWHENVVHVGLSGGFIEPLESTGLALITSAIRNIDLSIRKGFFTEQNVNNFNSYIELLYEDAVDFISMHYNKNKREESFWKFARETIKVSERQEFFENYLLDPNKPLGALEHTETIFPSFSWYLWMIQLGYRVTPKKLPLSDEIVYNTITHHYESFEDQMHVLSPLHSEYVDRKRHLLTKYGFDLMNLKR